MLLTDFVVRNQNDPGRYTDDQTKGLHLWVRPDGKKYWIQRFTLKGRRYGMGLGAYPDVSLRQARQKAVEARDAINKGINPIEVRQREKATATPKQETRFDQFALDFIETMRPKWRSHKHAEQWVSTVSMYAFPVIGSMPLDEIDTPHILQILQPIWLTKPETASRLRGRLAMILAAASTRKLRPPLNPATWAGHLQTLLPPPPKSDKHHAALPYADLPEFMVTLRDMDCVSALALEFAILNASRTGEVINGKRDEVSGNVWTIPANRMKAKKEHQVPLCRRSLDILTIARHLDPDSAYLFSRGRKPLSNMAMLMLVKRLRPDLTTHGFRACFRTWVSDETEYSPELAEMQLAHVIPNKTEAAYRRGNLLERRRRMMEHWEAYCHGLPWSNVFALPDAPSASPTARRA